jgi:hypothetical protein
MIQCADPDPFPGVLGSESGAMLVSRTKLTGRENLTKYAFWLGPGRPTDKKNQVRMYKNYGTVLGTLPFLYRTKQSDLDPYQLEKRVRIRIKRVWICNTAMII